MGMAFPLFTQQMLKALGYNWTNTLFALVAVALVPVPMVSIFIRVFFFGNDDEDDSVAVLLWTENSCKE